MRNVVIAAFLMIAGCGSTPNATDHKLALLQDPISFDKFYGFWFTLPSTGKVWFTANTYNNDTYDVGIFPATEWIAYSGGSANQPTAAVVRKDGNSGPDLVSDSATIASGDYYLGFVCRNPILMCIMVFDLDASY